MTKGVEFETYSAAFSVGAVAGAVLALAAEGFVLERMIAFFGRDFMLFTSAFGQIGLLGVGIAGLLGSALVGAAASSEYAYRRKQ